MPKNEFSELDYKPEKKRGCLLPALIITAVVVSTVVLIVIIGIRKETPNGITENRQEEQHEEPAPEITENAGEKELVDQEEEKVEETEAVPPDHDQLEDDIYKWLTLRVDDPEVIMVHTSELDDVKSFLERYSLEEDNIIVYRIESTEDQFATAVFGLPYSEWSIRAVFIWRDGKWNYLREEALR